MITISLRPMFWLAMAISLAACRMPQARPVDCDRHLVPINRSTSGPASPLAGADGHAVGGSTGG